MIALVLCGGSSSRMGRPKVLVEIQGVPYLERLAQQFHDLHLPMVLSCQPNQFTATYAQVHDMSEYSNAGPMSGVLSAMHQYPNQDILLLGSDHFLLDTNNLRNLIDAANATNDNCSLVLPEDLEIQPFPAVYRYSLFGSIQQAYLEGQLSLRKVLMQHGCRLVNATSAEVLRNFNTPEDLTRLA